MNSYEHTFPVPENATYELDHLKDELKDQPLVTKASDWIKANPWQAIGIAAGIAFLFSFFGGRRR